MTTAYTSLLGLALPVTGELSGTWGDTVNAGITSLVDSSVAGTTNISTDTDVTLTTTTGAANTARQTILLFSGARTALRTVTAPAQSKTYTVINATTGGFAVKLIGSGPTTGVTIIAGESAFCAWNGSDFVKVSNTGGAYTVTDLTVTGNTILGDASTDTATLNASSRFNALATFGYAGVSGSTLTTSAPAFVYSGATTYTDTSISGGTKTHGPFWSFAIPTLANPTTVTTYTNASTLYIAGAPAAGTNITITNPYSLYVAAGASYFGGAVSFIGNTTLTTTTVTSLTDSGLTAGRVTYAGTAGLLQDSANLTFDGTNLTLGGGTANGVTYLNGSKVLTSGSALTFNGTNSLTLNASAASLNLGITTNYGVVSAAGTNPAAIYFNGATRTSFQSHLQYFAANHTFFNETGGSEIMRLLNTGNVGVGTSNPITKFVVSNAGAEGLEVSPSGGTVSLTAYNRSGAAYAPLALIGSGGGTLTMGSTGGVFNTKVGISTTTSALSQSLNIDGSGGTLAGTASISLWDGNSGGSRRWAIANGASATGTSQIGVLTFSSGTGSFTADPLSAGFEIMRLTGSPSLNVGQTVTTGTVGAGETNATTTFSSLGYGMLSLTNKSNTANNYTWMTFNESNYNYVGAIGTQNQSHSPASGAVYGDLLFATKTNGLGGFPTEKMRLTSEGNLLINITTSNGYKVNVRTNAGATALDGEFISDGTRNLILAQSGSTYNYAGISANENIVYASGNPLNIVADSSLIKFSTGNERMRITNAGNVGIGTNNPAYLLTVNGVINNASNADPSPYTQQRITVYNDGGNWGYLGYGNDAIMRIVHATTASSYPLLFGTTSAANNTGTFTETMRISLTGALVLKGGTANPTGVGVTFPATQSASSDANTLDDYEEGSFNCTVTYSTTLTATPPTSTLTVTGYYVKVGNIVTCTFPEISRASTFSNTSVVISQFSLPFATANDGTWATNTTGFYNLEGQYGGTIINTNVAYIVQVPPNASKIDAQANTTNLQGGLYWRLADTSAAVRFSVTYKAA